MLNRHAHFDAAEPSGYIESARVGLPDVGLHIDDERSIAAVSRPSPANPSLHIASLHSTVLYVHADGTASLGGTSDPYAAAFTEFVSTEIASGFEPGDLVAMALRCLLVEVATSVGTEIENLAAAATFPTQWTAERVSSVRTAMNRNGLGHVALVSETEALAAWANATHATWAGKDSAIAAARGAAALAAAYPVDAVTEEIVVAGREKSTAAPFPTRTPILAAVALAAVLALGGGVASLVLNDSTAPEVPVIEGAPYAVPTTTTSAPGAMLPFPTVVPIIEPVLPPQAPEQPADPTEEERAASPEPAPARTQPAAVTEPPRSSEEAPPEEEPDIPDKEPLPEPPADPPPGPEDEEPTTPVENETPQNETQQNETQQKEAPQNRISQNDDDA